MFSGEPCAIILLWLKIFFYHVKPSPRQYHTFKSDVRQAGTYYALGTYDTPLLLAL